MEPKTRFVRWYGCDESNRIDTVDCIASKLGSHVRIGEGVCDPVDDDSLVVDRREALPGIYMLRCVSGMADLRNGVLPYIVIAYYEHAPSLDPGEDDPDLVAFERKLNVRPQ